MAAVGIGRLDDVDLVELRLGPPVAVVPDERHARVRHELRDLVRPGRDRVRAERREVVGLHDLDVDDRGREERVGGLELEDHGRRVHRGDRLDHVDAVLLLRHRLRVEVVVEGLHHVGCGDGVAVREVHAAPELERPRLAVLRARPRGGEIRGGAARRSPLRQAVPQQREQDLFPRERANHRIELGNALRRSNLQCRRPSSASWAGPTTRRVTTSDSAAATRTRGTKYRLFMLSPPGIWVARLPARAGRAGTPSRLLLYAIAPEGRCIAPARRSRAARQGGLARTT